MQIQSSESSKWNAGTWLALLLVLLAGSFVSDYLKNFTDSLLLYLPTSLAFVMVHWFGPRVLPLAYVNAFVTLILWNAPGGWDRIMILATREPVIVFTSWFLCKKFIPNMKGLSDTKVFSKYVLFGIVIPDLVNALYTFHYSFINGDLEKIALLWLSDFITLLTISLPLLHYFTPVKTKYAFKLSLNNPQALQTITPRSLLEVFIVTLFFLCLGFFISFDKYWFVYGACAAYVAVKFGFNYVIFVNVIIFVLNYVLPLIHFGIVEYGIHGHTQSVNVHLGMSTMFLGAALVGRVISDLRNSEDALREQKKQLESTNNQLRKTNQELDRFVYSVSHDINAPLKSIRGLIAISKLETKDQGGFPYISKIEDSIKKLEVFAEEVLQHSRTSRKTIELQEINLQHLVDEVWDNLQYMEGIKQVSFTKQLDYPIVHSDRFLLKIVLSNFISNAIKFQRKSASVHYIKVLSFNLNDRVYIEVEDNGEGIEDEYKDRIFEMFYRASTSAAGSGLGLFIAKETTEKLDGTIAFKTKYGEGTTFTISLPIHK